MLAAQVRSEALKVRSVRSLTALPVLTTLVGPAIALLVALTGSLRPDDTVLGGSLTGAGLGIALIGAWGALLVTTEYSTGTLGTVVAARPRREVVLTGKALVAVAVASAVGVVSSVGAWVIGGMLLDPSKYAAGAAFPALVGVAACYPVVACLGLAAGVLLRSSAGAVALMLSVAVLPGILGPLLGAAGPWVTGASPAAVVAKLAQSSDAAPEIMGTLGGWASLTVVCAYSALALAGAAVLFDRRDV
ncbi:ABC transporter permease subunit [Nocardia sp. NPDC055321]